VETIMERSHSDWRPERRLTPELFDHYIALARQERSKAIAAFPRQLAAWLSSLARRLGRGQSAERRGSVGAQTAR
jgi:hypothetical protein